MDTGGGQVVLYGVFRVAGKLLQHVLGVLLLCWQRMLRFGISVGVLSFIMAEVLGSALTRQFPPSILTTVVALVVSFALGYAAALTALADEIFVSAVDTIRLLEGDVRAGFRAASVAAEREAGEARQGVLRWLGHPPAPEKAAAVRMATASETALTTDTTTAMSPEQAETLEAIAATESFQSTAPRPRVSARPVRADQFPRIQWAYEPEDTAAAPAAGGSAPAVSAPFPDTPLPDMPPLPLRVPDAVPLAAPPDAVGDTVAAVDLESDGDDPAATLPAARKPAPTAPAFIPAKADATPLAPDSSSDRSIWARIGQALVGNTLPLAALGGTHTIAPQRDRTGQSGGEARDEHDRAGDASSGSDGEQSGRP